ncbi:MAG: hypothetical protein R3B84_08760 [Zavarzinella sp.]
MSRRNRTNMMLLALLMLPACNVSRTHHDMVHDYRPTRSVVVQPNRTIPPDQIPQMQRVGFAENRSEQPTPPPPLPGPPTPKPKADVPAKSPAAPVPAVRPTPAPISPAANLVQPPIRPIDTYPARLEPPVQPIPTFPTNKKLPVPDKDGIIKPEWPTIRTTNHELPSAAPVMMPPAASEAPAVTAQPTAPFTAPDYPKLPEEKLPELPSPSVIGDSQQPHSKRDSHKQDELPPKLVVETNRIGPTAHDSHLVNALRFVEQGDIEHANEALQNLPAINRHVLSRLLPLTHQIGHYDLQAVSTAQADRMLADIKPVCEILRARASLQAKNVCLCRDVRSYANHTPVPAGYRFHPGDMAYLYAELENFSCIHDARSGKFQVVLASEMELRNAAGMVVWKPSRAIHEPVEQFSNIPRDFYRAYRFVLDPKLPAGDYQLVLRIKDQPTGKQVEHAVLLTIGTR